MIKINFFINNNILFTYCRLEVLDAFHTSVHEKHKMEMEAEIGVRRLINLHHLFS